jgi:predicted metal-dependent HD superfamily phosphohydrolase
MASVTAWEDLTSEYDDRERTFALRDLTTRYSEPQRHYHTRAHVEALLAFADEYAESITDQKALGFAIWFHDAVYDVRRNDNEEASAELARSTMKRLGGESSLIERVVSMVLSTKMHQPTPDDFDTQLFLDFDLSILGSDAATYDLYAAAIRKEYSIVPSFLFKRERKKILSRFLERPQLYFTGVMRDRFERGARENLRREIARL